MPTKSLSVVLALMCATACTEAPREVTTTTTDGGLPVGSSCRSSDECENGACLVDPNTSRRKCYLSCASVGELCPGGGSCEVFGDTETLACPDLPVCASSTECGLNASCSQLEGAADKTCGCSDGFYGDPLVECGVCTAPNDRDGCVRNAAALAEVLGECRAADGTVGGACALRSDCPLDGEWGCYGYAPAVSADPPCACTDLRGIDLSGSAELPELTLAWYDATTVFPDGFDPTTSGALGPDAQVSGIDLSGSEPTTLTEPVVGDDVLAVVDELLLPDVAADGASVALQFSGPRGLSQQPITAGSVQITLQPTGIVFTDSNAAGVLSASDGSTGTIDYDSGTISLSLAAAAPVGTIATADYEAATPVLVEAGFDGTTDQASFTLAGVPLKPGSVKLSLGPEMVAPDTAFDGASTSARFSGENALKQLPVQPGTAVVEVGDVRLRDLTGDGVLSAADGSRGTLDYDSGVLSLQLAAAAAADTAASVEYASARQEELTPDVAFDGTQTAVSFGGDRAIENLPIAEGSLTVSVAEGVAPLVAHDGSTLTHSYYLEQSPVVLGGVEMTVGTERFTDAAEPGTLVGDAGGTGSVDPLTGRVDVLFQTAPAAGSTASADYDVRASGEAMAADSPFDGVSTTASFSGDNALSTTPIAPGSVQLRLGQLLFTDSDGLLSAADGSTGTIDYATGEVTLQTLVAPLPGSTPSARYAGAEAGVAVALTPALDGSTTTTSLDLGDRLLVPGSVLVTLTAAGAGTMSTADEALSTALPFDGLGTDFESAPAQGLTSLPVVAGSLSLDVAGVVLEDQGDGTLLATDGSTGTIDYTTGAVSLSLVTAPGPGATAVASYDSTTGLVLRDDGQGAVLGSDGSSGTLNYETGEVQLTFASAPVAGTSATASFQGLAPATVRPAAPFDGTTASHTLELADDTVTPGSLTVTVGAEVFSDDGQGGLTGSAGGAGTVDYATGLLTVTSATPPAAEAVAAVAYTRSAALTLRDRGDGVLAGNDGSSGQVDTNTGALALQLVRAPKAGAQVRVQLGVDAGTTLSDAATPGSLVGPDGSTGTIDYETGAVALNLASPPAADTAVEAKYSAERVVTALTDLRTIALSNADLSNSNLSYTDLSDANLAGANLQGADLTGALLAGANMGGADMQGAVLVDADLTDAVLAGTNLDGVELSPGTQLDPTDASAPEWLQSGVTDCSDIADADCEPGQFHPQALANAIVDGTVDPSSGALAGASLAGADLSQVRNLEGADLTGANLEGANLSGVKMAGANLTGANLRGAILSGAQAPDTVCPADGAACYDGGERCASGADSCEATRGAEAVLQRADLTGAQLDESDFSGADLQDSTLTAANLRSANLERAKIKGTKPADEEDSGSADGQDTQDSGALEAVDLTGADLRGTKLVEADLTRAVLRDIKTSDQTDLSKATMSGVDLRDAQLSGSTLDGADLEGADMAGLRTTDGTSFAAASLKMATLTESDLRSASFAGADLEGADLSDFVMNEATDMSGANLKGVNMTDACMTNAVALRGLTLEMVVLDGARMVGTDLEGTNLTGVSLEGAVLGAGSASSCRCFPEGGPRQCGTGSVKNALFTMAVLKNADLSQMDLRGVTMTGADLRGANLKGSDLRSADFNGADMSQLDLTGALLSGARFENVNLSGSSLAGAQVRDGVFKGADLAGTDLRGADLTGADMEGASLDHPLTNTDTLLREVNLTGGTVAGCIKADMSDASLNNGSLAGAGFQSPNGEAFDADRDFNCRINFEGALLASSAQTVCGGGRRFPTGWVEAGRTANNTYALEQLTEKLTSVKSELACAHAPGLDLRAISLAGADLRGANLEGTDFGPDDTGGQSTLMGASLGQARLKDASLQWVNLRNVDLSGAQLKGANFEHSDLRGADLTDIAINDSTKFELAKYSCRGERKRGCTLFPNYPTFRWRNLKMLGPESNLEGVDLSSYPGLTNPPVDLSATNLKSAQFLFSDITGVNFSGANLQGANFGNANVVNVNFGNANVKQAVFSGAKINLGTNLRGANITEANFVGTQGLPNVNGALCDDKTAFSSANIAWVFLLEISIAGDFPLYFPVITQELVQGWNVGGRCCFPVTGGIRLGC